MIPCSHTPTTHFTRFAANEAHCECKNRT